MTPYRSVDRWTASVVLPIMGMLLSVPMVDSHASPDEEGLFFQALETGRRPLLARARRLRKSQKSTPPGAGPYVLEKLRENDVVMLGEYHRSRQEVSFFSSGITGLVENGARNIALEFLSSRQQGEIDAFMDSAEHLGDRALRREKITELLFGFNCVFTVMTSKDYVDSVENVYLLRHSGHPDVKLIATGCDTAYFGDGDDCLEGGESRDRHMADVLSKAQGKTVWYGGMHHASNMRGRTTTLLKTLSPDKKVFSVASLNEKDEYMEKLFRYPEIARYLQERLPPTGSGGDAARLDKDFDLTNPAGEHVKFNLADPKNRTYDGFISLATSDSILHDQSPISDEYRNFIKKKVFDKLSPEEVKKVVELFKLALSDKPLTDEQKAEIEKINREDSPRNHLMKHLFNLAYDRTGKVFTDEDRRILE